MKVVLLEDVRKLGHKFEVKNVTPGYARNFLIPRGLAKIATDEALSELEHLKKASAEKLTALKVVAKELEDKFSSNPLAFSLKTDAKGTVFGSVKKEDIENKLKELGYQGEVQIERPLKTLGEEGVTLDLGGGVKSKIKVRVDKA